jgi:hypothetical protein
LQSKKIDFTGTIYPNAYLEVIAQIKDVIPIESTASALSQDKEIDGLPILQGPVCRENRACNPYQKLSLTFQKVILDLCCINR